MNLITETIEEIQRQDRVDDIDLSGVVEILHQANEAYNKALTIHLVSKSFFCSQQDPMKHNRCIKQYESCKSKQ